MVVIHCKIGGESLAVVELSCIYIAAVVQSLY